MSAKAAGGKGGKGGRGESAGCGVRDRARSGEDSSIRAEVFSDRTRGLAGSGTMRLPRRGALVL